MQKKVHLDEDVAAGFDALAQIQGKSVTRLVNELLRGFLAPIFAPIPSFPSAAPPVGLEESEVLEKDEDDPDPDLGPPVCTVDYDELEQAYEFVSIGAPYEHEAYLVTATGKILYPEQDLDEEDEAAELPDDASPEDYRPIPHRFDLNLGRDLNLRFIADRAPGWYDEVRGFFNRKGAYRRFREFVIRQGLEQAWYAYQEAETRKALVGWCRDHRIEVVFRK
jgi:hypothetical protein